MFDAAMGLAVTAAETGAAMIDLSSVDFTPLTATILSVVPSVLPVIVAVTGIRKGISFMMGAIRGC